ncbi:hypothetical protein GQ42DRAFT_161786 [Ramicandelaber brevisporus]|nr:hypothetical protein GQ42DRAFT_161786 [Ramicandelaber brevisporus]
MSFENKLIGHIRGVGPEITGSFNLKGNTLIARIQLAAPIEDPIYGQNAILGYNDLNDLNGEFKIELGSVIGPKKIRLLLKSGESDAKAEIVSMIEPSLPSPLKEDGTVTFILPE